MNGKKDTVFEGTDQRASDFEFNADVAVAFDDMLERSVPFYSEQQRLVANLAAALWQPGTAVYDIGCSTATTLINIANQVTEATRLVGYDNSPPMLDQARAKIAEAGLTHRVEVEHGDFNTDLTCLPLDNAGIVTMFLTLQFVRPLARDRVIRWIYDGLADGGALLVGEKILTNHGEMNRLFIDAYYDYKRDRGYSENEISRKREALENVLIPYRIEENLELFKRNGFEIAETFFQWFNFAGFLCIKKP